MKTYTIGAPQDLGAQVLGPQVREDLPSPTFVSAREAALDEQAALDDYDDYDDYDEQ
jgi:hypothetical protein